MVALGAEIPPEMGPREKWIFFFFFFFFRETHFHSVTTQMQAVVTLSDNLLPLHRVSPSIKWQ